LKEPTEERWHRLCEQATAERDPARLLELVTEVNELLKKQDEEKQQGSEDPANRSSKP
jgi:hypothetical protein